MGWLKRLWRSDRTYTPESLQAAAMMVETIQRMSDWPIEAMHEGNQPKQSSVSGTIPLAALQQAEQPDWPKLTGVNWVSDNTIEQRKESTMTISPNMQAKIDAVIAYMGTQPLAIDGPDEGDFDNGPIRMWVRDFADGAGRQAWRWALVEFVDTGRVFANVDFRNPWRVQAVLALNPTS